MTKDSTTKPSKKNLELARKIVDKKAVITKWPNGFDVDLIGSVGVRHESRAAKKSEAAAEAAEVVAGMLDREELILSDTWADDNL